MSQRLLFIPLCLCIATACAPPLAETGSSAQPILGGTAAAVGDYPTLVGINSGGGGLCTGTLIAPDLILTAAHCILPALVGASSQDQVTSRTYVIFDSVNLRGNTGVQRQASDTIPHTSYTANGAGDNDIGLIRLAEPMTDRVPTPISLQHDDVPIGISTEQVGFGVRTPNGQDGGELYSVGDMEAVSCSTYRALDANLLCFSQSNGLGKCLGDSGGPSFATIRGIKHIVGVTSFGDQACTLFGADTRIDAELDFLLSVAPELQCQEDGLCNNDCGTGSLPADTDCVICTKDEDCQNDTVCGPSGGCVTAPFTPGGDGAHCETDQDCDTKLCAITSDAQVCTSICENNAGCLDGLECHDPGEGSKLCLPSSDSGGCSIGNGQGASSGILLILMALVFYRRRHSC